MKKGLILLAALGLLVVWSSVLAVSPPGEIKQYKMRTEMNNPGWEALGIYCPAKGDDCVFDSQAEDCANDNLCTCGICSIMDMIYTVTNWIFVAVIILGVIFVSLGAYNIITAGGTAEKVTTGRTYIMYAAIGVAVGMLAKAIPAIARTILSLS